MAKVPFCSAVRTGVAFEERRRRRGEREGEGGGGGMKGTSLKRGK